MTVVWVVAVAVALALASAVGPVHAATVCGSKDCKPESMHPASAVELTDGMGHSYWMYDVDSSGLIAAAKQACVYYANAHVGASQTATFDDTCMPVLPIGGGGTYETISVTGTLRYINKSDGAVTSMQTSSWGLLQVACSDSINGNYASVGTNGQCYCNTGASWSPTLGACVTAVERWYSAKNSCEVKLGNPIAPLTGAKIVQEGLGISVGRESLSVVYDSRSKIPYVTPPTVINGVSGVASAPPAAFGSLWTSSAHKSLYIQRSGPSLTGFVVQAYRGDGQFISFTHPTSTSYVPVNPTVRDRLVPVLDTSGNQTSKVRLIDARGNIELYDMYSVTTGWKADLLSITYVNGGSVSYSYSDALTPGAPSPGLLLSMTDHQQRKVRFSYEAVANKPAPRIKQITGPDGAAIGFEYDAQNNLTRIVWPDGKSRTFLYERGDLAWAVTGTVDENNSRFATYTYDADGRAVGTEHAGGVDSYSVTYGTPPRLTVTETLVGSVFTRDHIWSAPDNVSVNLPNGAQSSLNVTSVGGMPILVGQTQAAGSGCGASTNASTLDAAGNVLSKDDFQGQRTCFAYDSSNRESMRVEGLANTVSCASVLPANSVLPAGSRRIATSWHPDWRLPTQVTEPLRKTTTVYHGQPDPFNSNATANCTSAATRSDGLPLPVVCRQVEQATLSSGVVDSTVPSRSSSFTYDSLGQVLTSTDPNGKTSTVAYYIDTTFNGSYDPYFDKVVLLLHGNGTSGSNAIVDAGPLGQSVSVVGNTQIGTGQSKFGGSSLAFDGTGDYVVVPSSDMAFGAGDFTIETFLFKTANNPNSSRIWNPNGDFVDGVIAAIDASGNFSVSASTNGSSWTHSLPVVANLANGQWYHLAITRSGGSLFAFVDGVKYTVTTTLGTAALSSYTGAGRVIGGQAGTDRALNGFIDEFRITKEVARYTANFTPPTQEFLNNGITMAATGHAIGDVQSVTNAAGHTTQFNLYDAAGRVRQITDSKGVVTDINYAPRGWASTVAVTAPGGSARTTIFTYDDVGQVTAVTNPDGTSVGYTYDAAHRTTGATDARGNSVTYTLDNVGNRIAEQIKDPSGTLQRSISRSFDALNRLQQVTGAAR